MTAANHQAQITALQHRGHLGLLSAADDERVPQFNFWKGYLSALRSLQDGSAIKMAAKDAASTYQPPAFFEAALAGLPVGIERFTMVEVTQHLRTHGVEVAAHAVPTGQLRGVPQLEDGIGPVVDLNGKHAVAGVKPQDGSNCHGASSETAIVGHAAPRLTPPQRNLLRKLIAGKSAMQGASSTSKAVAGSTLRSLVQHGLVHDDLTVTPAGQAVFAAPKAQAGFAHLVTILGVLVIALGLSTSCLLDGPDDLETAATVAQVADAASEDAAALSSRQWAATQVCGPHATPQWVGDKDLVCLRHQVTTAASSVLIAGRQD